MREASFLSQNEEKFRQVEQILDKDSTLTPDESANLFVELTDDLSYSRTHYPNSVSTKYLNSLTRGIFQKLTQARREKFDRVWVFWKYEVPLVVFKHRKKLLYAFLFFSLSMAIGIISTHYDEAFPRAVLGDEYVEMTLANIEKGDPMGVYKDSESNSMFFRITLNNVRVASYTFIAGLLFSFGSYYFLFMNGVMVGAFQYFFVTKGLFWQSALTIWIHGTIEISSIVIAGAAGITMGNSLLFPGTYPRKASLIKGAKDALKISIGLIPLFLFAAFLESYVTRLTDVSNAIRGGVILVSAGFILWYFVIYPRTLSKEYTA
ncbi:MAG: stage II sporulation protein M [Cytophagales bacterium]|nr:stage II sporulation protein M [Cytophagales bacterium]